MTDPHTRRILIILAARGDAETGPPFELPALAGAYYALKDRGVEVVLASSDEAPPRVTALREIASDEDALVRRFRADRAARDDLADVLPLDRVVLDDFDAVVCIGDAAETRACAPPDGAKNCLCRPDDRPCLVLATSSGRPAGPVLRFDTGTSAHEAVTVLVELLDRR